MDIMEDLYTTTFSNNESFFKRAAGEIESLRAQIADRDIEYNGCSTLLDATERAVESLEEQLTDVTAQRDSLEGALVLMLERIQEPPDRNCRCHISPPCNDCVDFGGEREAFEVAKEALASLKGE